MRRALIIFSVVLGVLVALVAGLFGALQTELARDEIATQLSQATAGTSTHVEVGAIEGLLPFDIRIIDLRLSDRDGVWLTADRIALTWSPGALLVGRLQVDDLTADTVELARTPVAEPEPQQAEPAGPLLPELPVDIDVRRASISRLALAAPILGEPASLSVDANARIGELADGLSASLALRQMSGETGIAAIDLGYRPADDVLKLYGDVEEPHGGIVGRLLGLPQGSALRVVLDGEGPLDGWRGRMSASLDGGPLLDLTAQVSGREARSVTFALRATPDALVPPEMTPLVAGGVTANGTIGIPSDGEAVQIANLSLRLAAGTVTASGTLGLRAPGDLTVKAALGGSAPFVRLTPEVAWTKTDLDARLRGTMDSPAANATLVVQGLAAAGHRIGTTRLALDALAKDGLEQPIQVRADLAASGVTAPDPRVTALLADGLRVKLNGSLDRTGAIVTEEIELRGARIRLAGSGRAAQWGAADRRAEARITIADWTAIGGVLGLPGRGSAEISLALTQGPGGERLEVSGAGRNLSIGDPTVDRLVGPTPTLHVALQGDAPADIAISDARFEGAKARLNASGSIRDRALDVSFDGTLDDVAAIEPAARGAATLKGTLGGTIDSPTVAAHITAPSLAFAGHAAEDLLLNVAASDLATAPRVTLDGTARLDTLPAQLALSANVAGARVDVDDLALALGNSRLAGKVTLVEGVAAGRLDLHAPDLREIGGLAGVAMGGELSAAVDLANTEGRQDARLSATGRRIAAADVLTSDSLELSGTMEDLLGAPTLALTVDLGKPVIADQPLDRLSASANGSPSALAVRASLAGVDLEAAADAELVQTETGYRVDVRRLNAHFRDIDVKSQGPTVIEIAGESTRIAPVAFAIEDGALRLRGALAADQMDLDIAMESLPLSLARAFAPDLPLSGRIDGEARISGTAGAPSGSFALSGTGIGASDLKEQQADLKLSGTLQQGRLDLKGTLTPRTGGALELAAAVPALRADATLQARANGTLDLALVDAFLAGGADRVKGKADLDLAATGTLGAPRLAGELRLLDADYHNQRYGIRLRQIAAELRADGPRLEIVRFSGATPDSGKVSGHGTVDLTRGVAMDLAFQARNATVIDTDLATARIDGDVAITGSTDTRLALGGTIRILRADIRVPDRLPASVQQIEVKEVNVPPRLAARAAAHEAKPQETLVMDLDLAVEAPLPVAVRGRGLDVDLGGDIHIAGTADRPDIAGGFKLRRGTLDIVGKRLDFTEGTMTFEGGEQVDPILDLTAVARATDLEVTAKVEGPARAPRISLSSTPVMPEDEILARLLFAKSAGALSAFELLQVAQATAELAGVQSGPGVIEKIRGRTGLDRLAIEETESSSGPSLSAGRYVADGVYVGVSQGTGAGKSAATVEIEVTPNIKVESEIGTDAGSKAGVNLEWDY